MARRSSTRPADPGRVFGDDLASPGALRSIRGRENGALDLDFERASGELAVALDGSVRIRLVAASSLPAELGAALGRDPWPLASLDARRDRRGSIVVATGEAEGQPRIQISEDPFALRVIARDGNDLAELVDFRVGAGPRGGGSAQLVSGQREHLFGFGEKSGSLDRRGRAMLMRNRDADLRLSRDALYVSIPFFLGLEPARGVARGLLLESAGASFIDAAASDAERVGLRCAFGPLEITFYAGPDPKDVLRRFTAHVGRSTLPPRWAIGHHQSRWSYGSERAVRRVARDIRARGIATDAIHLDIDYMRGYRVFTWNERRFPEPARLIAELAEQGLRTVPIVDPGVKVDEDYDVYREGRDRDFFCRDQAGEPFSLRVWPGAAMLPDFNRQDVRRWWAARHAALLDAGAAGIWNDMNEPAGWLHSINVGKLIVPLRMRSFDRLTQRSAVDEKETTAHEAVRNVYGLQECRATRQALEQAHPGERPFVLSRSGYAGIQRFAALWTGDSHSRWRDLRQSVPMLLGLSVSGVAFCGADIGGFAGSATPELFARWIQIGALYPFARTHSMWLGRRQEAWRFGRRVEGIAREALALRMRLLPYLYSLFHEAEASGAPIWRPLFWEFPSDVEAASIEDQVMIGPQLLAAPVLERGRTSREVYLPAGVWLDWYDDARYVGPRRVHVDAPLERIPLFLRGGSALPTQSAVQHTGERPAEPVVIEVAPGADGSFVLIEDDGSSLRYRPRADGGDGLIARTRLRVRDRKAGRLRLEIARRDGAHAIEERDLRVCFRGCPRPTAVLLDGEQLSPGSGRPAYEVEDGRTRVRLRDAGEVHTIELEPAP